MLSDTEPLSTDVIFRRGFQEAIRIISLKLHVTEYIPSPTHPQRPVIKFAGICKGSVSSFPSVSSVSQATDRIAEQ
jgi:hypothetical protein